MLIKENDLINLSLEAKDGKIGHIKDLLFDDQHWTARFLVVNTGSWLVNRKVVISPIAIKETFNPESKHIPVDLTKEQIEAAPALGDTQPVSRQNEIDYLKHYGWPSYWIGGASWGITTFPNSLYNMVGEEVESDESGKDKHLRSADEIKGYHILTSDGKVGHVKNFLINTKTWRLRYMVIETGNWLVGKKILLSTNWVQDINWKEKTIKVDVTKAQIEKSPEYDQNSLISEVYEKQLFEFYGKLIDWS